MQTINISDFRANLLKYLEIANSGEQLTVTSNGKLLATITPPQNKMELAKKTLKALGKNAIVHDVVSSTESEWDAMS
jgi:prevent-host-death family protein